MERNEEKKFVMGFIMQLILIEKISKYDLWHSSSIVLPNNYLDIMKELIEDESRKEKYLHIIPKDNLEEWSVGISEAFKSVIKDNDVIVEYQNDGFKLTFDKNVTSYILLNNEITLNERIEFCAFANAFVNKGKSKSKVKVK